MPDNNAKKSGSIMPIIDFTARVAWLLSRFAIKLTVAIVAFTLTAIAKIWGAIGKIESCEKFCRAVSGFFRGIGKIIRFIFIIPWRFGEFAGKRCDASVAARRMFLIFILILGGLYWRYCTPAFDWGKWRYCERGIASYYGKGFYLQRTASGEWFLPGPFYTAAHKTLPLGATVLVVNEHNKRRVVVSINDRGPYVDGRIIDLSKAAAAEIGIYEPGTAPVTLYTRKDFGQGGQIITLYPEAPEWIKSMMQKKKE
jgi:rare lipoprotein A